MKTIGFRLGFAALLGSSLALAQAPARSGTTDTRPGVTTGVLGLVSKVRAAYGDITRARSLLSGSSQASSGHAAQSLLSKAERDLSLVKSALPTGAILAKVEQAKAALGGSNASGQGSKTSSLLKEAKTMAAKLDPEIASKLGEAQSHAQNGNSAKASSRLDEARAKLKHSPVETAYDKVVAAETALSSGKSGAASQLLGQVPSLHSLEGTVQRELQSATGIGGSGTAGIKLPGGFQPLR